MKIAIINGPNLNLLGTRETDLYGSTSFEQYFEKLRNNHPKIDFDYFQSNIEGELITEVQRAGAKMDGIIINPGGYTHTSVALGDAIAAVKAPVVEVHLTNLHAREDFRSINHVSASCKGTIMGFGLKGYHLAVHYLAG